MTRQQRLRDDAKARMTAKFEPDGLTSPSSGRAPGNQVLNISRGNSEPVIKPRLVWWPSLGMVVLAPLPALVE